MDPAQLAELQAFSRQEEMNSVVGRFSSPVQQFYRDATVLVTGGSGFLGKQLVEKLFRSCKIKKIYLLLRTKKGKTIEERMNQMLSDPVFDDLCKKQTDFSSKLVPIQGDAGDLNLGISKQDWDVLTEQVNVIFHMAATVRFDEPLRVATLINVRGTREAITLARQCRSLKKFIHVSTAFAHATYSRVGQKVFEEFGSAPVPPDVMIGLAETVEESRLNDITIDLIKDWPNTYTFTKAIAEDAVRTMAADLPACVVRPAIVIASYTEPSPGWLDTSCIFGPTGFTNFNADSLVFYQIITGIGLGGIRTLFMDVNGRLAFVPVDFVNNATIAAGWDSTVRREQGEQDIPIYTIANEECAMTMKSIDKNLQSNEFRRMRSPLALWYCYVVDTNNRLYFWLLTWLLHYIPAYIGDAVVTVLRIRLPKEVPSFIKIYDKIQKLTAVYNYFLTNEFLFQDHNVRKMITRMSVEDRAIYNCDLSTVDHKEFVKMWVVGIRKYILKDGLTGSEKAFKRQFYFKIANYAVMYLVCVLFFWKMFKYIS